MRNLLKRLKKFWLLTDSFTEVDATPMFETTELTHEEWARPRQAIYIPYKPRDPVKEIVNQIEQ